MSTIDYKLWSILPTAVTVIVWLFLMILRDERQRNRKKNEIEKRGSDLEKLKCTFQATFANLQSPSRVSGLDQPQVRMLYAIFLSKGMCLSLYSELPFVLDTPDDAAGKARDEKNLRDLSGMCLIGFRKGNVWATEKGEEYVLMNIL